MRIIFKNTKLALGIAIAFALTNALTGVAQANPIKQSPIITALQNVNQPLSKESNKWIKRWKGKNLEDPGFVYVELAGTTQIYLKIHQLDADDLDDGLKAYGNFVTPHGSSNPDTEAAYFNLAAILGRDSLMRPAVPYTLGPKAAQGFKLLLNKEMGKTDPQDRRYLRINRLLDWLKKPPLLGALKAKKPDSATELKGFANIPPGQPRGGPLKGGPMQSNPIMKALQVTNPKPAAGTPFTLQPGYTGDLAELAREYSIIMTLDVVFQQWDRYNNTNIGIVNDDANIAHFFITDNGGAELVEDAIWAKANLGYFSRYDRRTIVKLTQLYNFLDKPTAGAGFMGYKSAEKFVVDLGLYSKTTPSTYVRLLKRNLKLLLDKVTYVQRKYGMRATYL